MNQTEETFEVGCPNCGKAKKARRSDDGRRVRCECGAPFVITLSSALNDSKLIVSRKDIRDAKPSRPISKQQAPPDVEDDIPVLKDDQGTDRETARRACPVCGEMIVTSAVKCRFCGEFVRSHSDRARQRIDDDGDDDEPIQAVRMKYCHECGRQIRQRAEICPSCGVRQPDGGDRSSRTSNSRDKVKTPLLISAISNIVVGLIWLSTIIGVIFTVPMAILCICEFGLWSKADRLSLKQLGDKAKSLAVFEIVIGLVNTPTLICGIITLIQSGKLVNQYEE